MFQVCSPSSSAAQTGRNPIHVNVQNLDPIFYNRNDNVSGFAGVPRPMTGIAQLLRDRAGYRTHFFGKWDAGMATADHLPSARGYDSALFYFHHMVNYWASTFENANGAVSHFDSCADAAEKAGLPEGFRPVDLWRSNATRNAPAPVTLRNPPAATSATGTSAPTRRLPALSRFPSAPWPAARSKATSSARAARGRRRARTRQRVVLCVLGAARHPHAAHGARGLVRQVRARRRLATEAVPRARRLHR